MSNGVTAARRRRAAPTRRPRAERRTASRSFTSAPSLATRLSPSRIGFTSSTSARRRARPSGGSRRRRRARSASSVGAPPSLSRGPRLDLLAVRGVVGQALARRVDEGPEHDPLPVLGVRSSRSSKAWKPRRMFFDSSMRSTRTISSRSRRPRRARRARRRTPARRPRRDVVGVGRERRHERGAARGRRRAGRARKASAQRSVWKPQARWAAMPSSSSRGRGSGRAPATPAGRTGVWLKCTHARSGRVGAEPGRDQAQVVVLHEHGGAVGRGLGHGVGEGVVDRAVGVPGVGPRGVEGRPRARSQRPWWTNQRISLLTTS